MQHVSFRLCRWLALLLRLRSRALRTSLCFSWLNPTSATPARSWRRRSSRTGFAPTPPADFEDAALLKAGQLPRPRHRRIASAAITGSIWCSRAPCGPATIAVVTTARRPTRSWKQKRRRSAPCAWSPRGTIPPMLCRAARVQAAEPVVSAAPAHNGRLPAAPSSTASTGRCAACASPSPTAATSAASTACRRRTTPGCRARASSTSRRSRCSRTPSPSLGVDRVRLTGGEPLLRRDLPTLIELLAARPGHPRPGADHQRRAARPPGRRPARRRPAPPHRQPRHAAPRSLPGAHPVRRAARRPRRHRRGGARRLRVPEDRHRRAARTQRRRAGRRSSSSAGTVGAEVRFIEYMDVGGATHWSMDAVVSRREILARLSQRTADRAVPGRDSAPAERFRLPDGTTFGIIASTTEPFCAACDRSRLTADGLWLLCLYARGGLDLRHPLREGATREELRAPDLDRVVDARRSGRRRAARLSRRASVLIPVAALKRDAHLEMHTAEVRSGSLP